jgi:metal-dependent HD superfamily phosphatase/phosphodiesterase
MTGDSTVHCTLYCTVYNIRIYQLLLTHGAKVVPSFFMSEKGGEERQALVPLLATTLYCICNTLPL